MSALLALFRHEVRESRTSLIAAPLVTLAVLVAAASAFPSRGKEAGSTLACIWMLVPLWTLYFAADSFAGDMSSGRMRTRALLPVCAIELWRAKVVFVASTVTAITAWTIGCAFVVEMALGTDATLLHFTDQVARWNVVNVSIPVLAAVAILCSILVDSALVAMFLSLFAFVAAFGVLSLFDGALNAVGLTLSTDQVVLAEVGVTAFALAVGAAAFVRGQRRFGARAPRVVTVVAWCGALVVAGGISISAEVRRRATADVALSDTSILGSAISPDGRYLALEVENGTRGIRHAVRAVWTIDVESKDCELLASPATLGSDTVAGRRLPWRADGTLDVEPYGLVDDEIEYALARRVDGAWSVAGLDAASLRPGTHAPAWATTQRSFDVRNKVGTLRVRWSERGVERVFEGVAPESRLGLGVFLSPVPGRALALRGGELRLVDFATDEERVLLASGVKYAQPNEDGSAVLATCKDGTRVLATDDGRELSAAWPPRTAAVSWIDGDGRCVVERGTGKGAKTYVLDLDTGVRFELPYDRDNPIVRRLGERGYVCVVDDDLVLLDPTGKHVETWIDR